MDNLLKPPPAPPAFDEGESDVERVVKYLRLAELGRNIHPPLSHRSLDFWKPEATSLWTKICSYAEGGVGYDDDDILSSATLGSLPLRAMRIGYIQTLNNLIMDNQRKLNFYITELRQKSEETLHSLPERDYQSKRYYAVGRKLVKLRAQLNALDQPKPETADWQTQLRLVNNRAVIEARLQLLKQEIICVDNSAPPSAVEGTVNRVKTKLWFSLAKAESSSSTLMDPLKRFEVGESNLERVLKYARVSGLSVFKAQPLDQLEQFREWADLVWTSVERKANVSLSWSSVTSSIDYRGLRSTTSRVAFFSMLASLTGEETRKLIDTLNTDATQRLEHLHALYTSSTPYKVNKQLKMFAKRLSNLAELKDHTARMNAYALLDTRLVLYEQEMKCIHNAQEAKARAGLVQSARSHLGLLSLAKANAWEGSGSNRISPRRATQYRINSS